MATSRPGPIVVAVRILLILLGTGALVLALELTSSERSADHARACFVCPMHPEARATEPGVCPICGMKLEGTGCATTGPERNLPGIADLEAVENVRRHNIIDFVRRRSLLGSQRELRAPAWIDDHGMVTALFYDDQIAALGPDERGSFVPTQTPQASLSVRRTLEPPLRWDRSTSGLRFRFDVGSAAAEAGQVGWLSLAPRPRQVLTVPASAVLQSPEGPYVLMAIGDYRFVKQSIEIGATYLKEGFATVLSGVRVNDRVVARATFFVDADRRLRSERGDAGLAAP